MSFHVLLVDDSSAMRRMIRRVLEISGFPVSSCLEAAHGREALATLEQGPVDVVLTDINMPVMDGEAFVRSLRQNERFAGLPVIVVSTDSTSIRRERLESLGAQGYLSKPFTPEGLRSELERVLEANSMAGGAWMAAEASNDGSDF